SFSRRHPLAHAKVDVVGVVRSALVLAVPWARSRAVIITENLPESPQELQGDEDRLLQAVMNLIRNGIQATPRGASLLVELRSDCLPFEDDPEGPSTEHICVVVEDAGDGVSEEVRAQLFRPFVSTKTAEDGVGLGLSMAQSIAKDHRGAIVFE